MKFRWPFVRRSTHEATVTKMAGRFEKARLEHAAEVAKLREENRTNLAGFQDQQRTHKLWEQRDALNSFMANPRSFEVLASMHELLLSLCDPVTQEFYRTALRKKWGPFAVDPMLEHQEPFLETVAKGDAG